jgi:D-alanyl-D-alanine carboxypeptidase (penicillin-binding protein 5/6)
MLLNITLSAVEITAKSAVVIDMNSKKILYIKNGNEKLPFASTTKIMTAIVAIEMCDLQEVVKVDDKAVEIEGSSIYLQKGEELTLSDLLYGLMLHSGNDAAEAIAYHISGSIENFAALMNYKAKLIGADNTNFINPHGLPNELHYTTASDLAHICIYAMQNDTFRQIVATKSITVKTNGTGINRNLVNKNKLLYSYEGANGIKTGYTDLAGRCLCGAAEQNGMQLISVVLNSKDIYGDTQKLFDYYFENYSEHTFMKKGEYVLSIPVQNSYKKIYRVYLPEDISVPVKKDEIQTTQIKYNFIKKINAPMQKGDKIGEIEIIFDDNSNIVVDIILEKDIKYKNSIFENIQNYLRSMK